ncbi:MAG: DUF2062 domain-containing protein [Halieaceae bacterium]|nr:DUF2062 domain-containing protein [Halieaceae bacterium]
MSLYRRLRYQVLRLRKLSGSPHSLALGCGIGVFLGIMPVLPLRSVLIFLVSIPARANVVAAIVVGTVIANPFVLVVWYSAALTCGNLLVEDAVTWERVSGMLDSIKQTGFTDSLSLVATIGWDMVFVLLAGGLLIALPAGVASYLVALRYFSRRLQAATAEPG